MFDEPLVLIKKKTDIPIQQRKQSLRKLNESSKYISCFITTLKLEEDKWLLGLTYSKVYKSGYNIKEENYFFSLFPECYWTDLVISRQIKASTVLRDLKDFELHVNKVGKKQTVLEVGSNPFTLSNFDDYFLTNDVFETLKNNKNNKIEDMAFRMNLTYSELEKSLDFIILILFYKFLSYLQEITKL